MFRQNVKITKVVQNSMIILECSVFANIYFSGNSWLQKGQQKLERFISRS